MTLALAILVCAAIAAVTLEAGLGSLRLEWLQRQPALPDASCPPVSVVIAARNEERHVGAALSSVLRLQYPDLEVIVVNDRSDDATGAILDELRNEWPRLTVVHVTELPDGWLGKNHALHRGASAARGEYLLFSDADVVFGPAALRKAMQYVRARGLDHLAVAPAITSPSPGVRAFVASFSFFFGIATRPWRARDPRSRASVGIGAFNLVRTAFYRAAGGHTAVRLRPDDDLMLGRVLKRRGARADLLFGRGEVSLDWYGDLRELVAGLMKNAFAGCRYSRAVVAASIVSLLAIGVGPLVGAVTATGLAGGLFALAAALLLASAAVSTRAAGLAPWYALALPWASVLFSWILLRAAVLTVRRGGIEWRGTFYALEDLRRNQV